MNFLRKKRLHNAGNPKGFWGKYTLRAMNKEHIELTEKGLALIYIPPNAVCLDIGCGGGRTISRLSVLSEDGVVYGLDISETSLLRSARYNKRGVERGKIILKKGSASEKLFEDEMFDVVTAVETFYFWEDKPQCVQNIFDSLKKDGVFIVMLDAYADGTDHMKDIVKEINLQLDTAEDIEKMFEDAGFSSISVIKSGKRLFVKGIK